MKNGNWLPISKVFVKDLPHGRQYTRLEAAYSLQFDYDCKNSVTVAGYSALWRWSRTRVSKFLKDMKVEIIYPEETVKKQNQKGQIAIQIQDRSETDNKQIRLIENTYLQIEKDRPKTDEGQIKNRSGSTTKDPLNLNPKPNPKSTTGKKFQKPTLEDVKAYCLERNNSVDAEAFINHYESNGWKVGKNSMKCWKSAVRTWEKNNFNTSGNGKQKTFDDFVSEGFKKNKEKIYVG